ncbi:hypothetical protein K8I85_05320 [bacterium]|nr:hypothetical protein [bacterium]
MAANPRSARETPPRRSRPWRLRVRSALVSPIFLIIAAMALLAGVARLFHPMAPFSVDVVVSELQMTLLSDSSLLPANTAVRAVQVFGVGAIEVPWARRAGSDEIVDEQVLEGGMSIIANTRDASVGAWSVPAGTRVSLVSDRGGDRVFWLFENARDDSSGTNTGWQPVTISVHGDVSLLSRSGAVQDLTFASSRAVRVLDQDAAWEMSFHPTDRELPVLLPAIDLESLAFQVTGDGLESQARGRIGQSAVREGRIYLRAIENGVAAVMPGDSILHTRVESLRLDELRLTKDGFRVRYHGKASGLEVGRVGERAEIAPTALTMLYRTEGGRLVAMIILSALLLILESLLDQPRSGRV